MTKELRQLYTYQEAVVQFLRGSSRGCLFLDPGLGKTICAIRGLDLKESGNTLFVVPASLVPNWEAELRMEQIPSHRCRVISYEKLVSEVKSQLECVSMKDTEKAVARRLKLLKRHYVKYDNLVIDESHYIRNYETKRAEAIAMIHRFITRVVFLSGSPTVKSNQDLYTTLNIVSLGKFGNYHEFCGKYCEIKYNKWDGDYEATGFKNSDVLAKKMRKFCVVIKKDAIADQLPEKRENILWVENIKYKFGFTGELADLFEDANEDHISTIRREAAHAKMADYIRTLKIRCINDGLIFCWHKDVGEALKKKLPKCGLITGDVPIAERYKLIEKYQSGKLNWLVITISAGGVGLNIQRAAYVGFFEMCFTDAELEQALSRTIRLGNVHESVQVEYVLLRESIDVAIYYIAKQRKLESDWLMKNLKILSEFNND